MIQVSINRRKRRFRLGAMLAVFRVLQQTHAIELHLDHVMPSTEFIVAAAGELSKRLRADVTPTVAYLLWRLALDCVDAIRERNTENADIAFWYGLDPFDMPESNRLALLANLPRVKAQDTLHSGHYDNTDFEAVYSMFKLATDDERLARAEQLAAAKRFVDISIKRGRQ